MRRPGDASTWATATGTAAALEGLERTVVGWEEVRSMEASVLARVHACPETFDGLLRDDAAASGERPPLPIPRASTARPPPGRRAPAPRAPSR